MSLRPQDLLVSVKLAISPRATYPWLSRELGLSLSEVHGAVRRATEAGLLTKDREPARSALLEFILHGVKFSFVPKRGRLTRGMPTAYAAPPLSDAIDPGAEPVPVWPDADGTVRGESFEPLYPSAPAAARRDSHLYEILALIDAIRGGRARERALAEKHLRKALKV
jgi:hypothetical protein